MSRTFYNFNLNLLKINLDFLINRATSNNPIKLQWAEEKECMFSTFYFFFHSVNLGMIWSVKLRIRFLSPNFDHSYFRWLYYDSKWPRVRINRPSHDRYQAVWDISRRHSYQDRMHRPALCKYDQVMICTKQCDISADVTPTKIECIVPPYVSVVLSTEKINTGSVLVQQNLNIQRTIVIVSIVFCT